MCTSLVYNVAKMGSVEAEGEQFQITLGDILFFTTVSPSKPPLGFIPKPSLSFEMDSPFPRANTCTNTLYIPMHHTSLGAFVYHMCFGILNSPGFGQL